MFFRTLAIASSGVILATTSLMAAEYQCQKADSSLRLAIEVKKEGHTLPCEVIAEDDRGERAVLYSAKFDRNYCPARIEKTRSELEADGWACEKSSDQNVVQGNGKLQPGRDLGAKPTDTDGAAETSSVADTAPVPADNGVTVADIRHCRRSGELRRIQIEVDNPERGRPCSLIYWAEDDRSDDGRLLWRAVHDAAFCPKRLGTIVDKWSEEGWQCESVDVQTAALPKTESGTAFSPELAYEEVGQPPAEDRPAEGASGGPIEPNPTLKVIVEADAKRIGEWMEVEPAIEIAAHGDLNDDGNDDALVFLAYQSDQAAYRQYLMSYLGAGDSYELAGVKLLTGVSAPPAQAKVERIDEGVIWLSLAASDGTRRSPTGYVLRNQQLVEVDAESTSQSAAN